jgi:uncharacterized protein (DUF4415 family)
MKALASMPPGEDERIDAGIAADPDSPELGEAFFAKAVRGRGPQRNPTKRLISLRLDPEVIDRFRATGPGWQARMNDALRKAAGL